MPDTAHIHEVTQYFEQITNYMIQVGDPTNPDLGTVVGTVAAPITYEYRASSAESIKTIVERVLVVVHGNNVTPPKFGGLAALTNGIKFQICDAIGTCRKTYPQDITGFNTIKTNADWVRLAGVDSIPIAGVGVAGIHSVRWTLGRGPGALWLPPGWALQCIVQDDLTGTTPFTVNVQGHQISDQPGQIASD